MSVCVCLSMCVCAHVCIMTPLGSNLTTDEGPWKGAEKLGLTPVCIPGAFMWMGGLGEALDMFQGAPPPRECPSPREHLLPGCTPCRRAPPAGTSSDTLQQQGWRWG